ncbi:MAG: hypothetical protein JKY48_16730 [Flavobacteriales bacterium]|nr:hypothetical protein [Flavobacteriales bacterium]
MKKIMICLSFASMLLIACGGEKAPTTEENVVEVPAVDSVAVEMHQASEDIEKSTEELDELLNDL